MRLGQGGGRDGKPLPLRARAHIPLDDRGGERAAFMYTLIGTAKLNDIDPQVWLADVLARIADLPQSRLREPLPWNWRRPAELLKPA